jgi:hypothetical protein
VNKSFEAEFLPRAAAAGPASPEAVPPSPSAEKRRILIVDDDANSTHLVKILL